MKVKISKEKVFWNSITDNKPSHEYFSQFKANMVESELQVNQDNFLTITVATQNRDITYIEIEHRDYTGYYYYNSIQKITNGGYVITFKLDIWTTFTLPFLQNLNDNNIQLKAIRHHILSKQSAFYTDEMKNSVPIMYNSIKKTSTLITDYGYQTVSNKVRWKAKIYGGTDWGTNGQYLEIVKDSTWKPDSDSLLSASGTLCYVYKINTALGTWESSYMIIPIFYMNQNYEEMNFVNNYDVITSNRIVKIVNDYQTLQYLTNTAKFLLGTNQPSDDDKTLNANFMGIYCLPSIFSLKTSLNKITDVVRVYTGTKTNYTEYNLLSLRGDINGQIITKDFKLINDAFFNLIPHDEQVPSLNYDTKLHALVSDAYSLKWFNNIIKPSLLYEKDKGITFNKICWGISQEPFLKVYSDTGFNLDTVYTFTNELPSYQDSYLEYLTNTRYTRDNQLNIFKQQLILNTTKNIFGAITSGWFPIGRAALGLKYGDRVAFGEGLRGGLGVANSLSFGLADTILGYQNNVNTLKAQYADYAASTGNNINPGSVDDIITSSFNYLTVSPSYAIEYKDLTKDTIKALNNIIYLYGNFNPIYETYSNLQPRNDFNYLQLDKEYLTTIFNQYINTNVPIEVYSLILDTLTSGVRICKTDIPKSN